VRPTENHSAPSRDGALNAFISRQAGIWRLRIHLKHTLQALQQAMNTVSLKT
jgi:hypothetical protein